MKFIDALMKEYSNGGKIDISNKVKERRHKNHGWVSLVEQRNPKLILTNAQTTLLFQSQVQAFINDFMIIFSDYDESNDKIFQGEEL